MENPWNELDTQLMVMAAHRYALGRQSYIVGSAISWIWKYRKNFERQTIHTIIKDTAENLMDNRVPHQFVSVWTNIASNLYAELPDDEKDEVKKSLDWKVSEWPFYDIPKNIMETENA